MSRWFCCVRMDDMYDMADDDNVDRNVAVVVDAAGAKGEDKT